MNILAHRTAMGNEPENSLAGIELCYRENVAAFECDVTFFRGEGYVTLDKYPKKQSGGNCSEYPMTVDQLLKFIRTRSYKNIKVMFDIKFYGHANAGPEEIGDLHGHLKEITQEMIDAVFFKIIFPAERYGVLNKIGFVTFQGGFKLLEAAKYYDPRIFTELIVIFPWTNVSRYSHSLDAITIGWKRFNHWRLFPFSVARITKEAHKNNLLVNGGLTNNKPEIDWAFRKGFDGIWTDDILRAKRLGG